jgi:molybdenum cofactor cytidylyltransferase
MRRSSAAKSPRLAALVLAAGGSTRLGRPKQLLRLRGETLLARACRLARSAADGAVIVVLGAEALRMQSVLRQRDRGLSIVHNAGWRDGMAGSLHAGLAALPEGTDGLLILLVDQARIEPADLRRLVELWRRRPARPAASFYLGRAGVPAVIPRRHFKDLRSLEGDVGARQLLRRVGRITPVPMPAAAFDVDTPEDAAELSQAAN